MTEVLDKNEVRRARYRARTPEQVAHDRAQNLIMARRYKSTDEYKRKAQNYYVMRKHGMTIEEYEALRAAAGGVCGICRLPSERLELDHCHATGVRRKFLCPPCNKLLGHAKDDPAILRAAMEYLEEHRMVSVD